MPVLHREMICYNHLETLAVVWAVTHFHAYLYGPDVLVYSDHSAVLETPSASGKHACWWGKSFLVVACEILTAQEKKMLLCPDPL